MGGMEPAKGKEPEGVGGAGGFPAGWMTSLEKPR